MKTRVGIVLVAFATVTVSLSHAQSFAVPWSAMDAGFAAATSGNTRVISAAGQALVGTALAANQGVKSGFLVYPFRPLLSSGIHPGGSNGVPFVYDLNQNYPNPFNPTTIIRYTVGGAEGRGSGVSVRLTIYDLLGREVATLVNERKVPGSYEVQFAGGGLASGVYIYRLTAGSFVQSKKMILMK